MPTTKGKSRATQPLIILRQPYFWQPLVLVLGCRWLSKARYCRVKVKRVQHMATCDVSTKSNKNLMGLLIHTASNRVNQAHHFSPIRPERCSRYCKKSVKRLIGIDIQCQIPRATWTSFGLRLPSQFLRTLLSS
jgi:hypothetical protein